MRILRVDSSLSRVIVNKYKNILNTLIDQYASSGILDDFMKTYDIDMLHRAVDYIYFDGTSVCTPVNGQYEFVLKALQFGCRGLPALNLISKAAGGIYE